MPHLSTPGSLSLGALSVGLLVLVALAVRTFVLSVEVVGSPSMEPTLPEGSVVLVDRRPGQLRDLHRGDVITFASPADGAATVKRVVGLPGDVVAIEDALLVVDGRQVVEPYVDHDAIDATYYGPVVVPVDHVLVLGDERAGSIDSRDFGPVPLTDVDGRVVLTLR